MAKHTWKIKEKPFRQLKDGRRKVIARVWNSGIDRVKEGDTVSFRGYDAEKFEIVRTTKYPDWKMLLKGEGVENVEPGIDFENALKDLRNRYPAGETRGVCAFELLYKGDVSVNGVNDIETGQPSAYFNLSDLLKLGVGRIFSLIIAQVYMLTDCCFNALNFNYCEFFYGHYLAGLLSGECEIIACLFGEKVVGATILEKNGDERRLSGFYISSEYSETGLRTELFERSFAWLGTNKPVAIVAGFSVNALTDIIEQNGWVRGEVLPADRKCSVARYVFNETPESPL